MPSQDDLIQAFKAKASSGKCAWCDAKDWTVVSGAEHFTALMLSNVEGLTTKGGIETLAFACKNCGYVQLHQTSLLGQQPQ